MPSRSIVEMGPRPLSNVQSEPGRFLNADTVPG